MKKTLYMAAVLATLAGCAKTESQPENPVGSNLELTANVEGIGTKAVLTGIHISSLRRVTRSVLLLHFRLHLTRL